MQVRDGWPSKSVGGKGLKNFQKMKKIEDQINILDHILVSLCTKNSMLCWKDWNALEMLELNMLLWFFSSISSLSSWSAANSNVRDNSILSSPQVWQFDFAYNNVLLYIEQEMSITMYMYFLFKWYVLNVW